MRFEDIYGRYEARELSTNLALFFGNRCLGRYNGEGKIIDPIAALEEAA